MTGNFIRGASDCLHVCIRLVPHRSPLPLLKYVAARHQYDNDHHDLHHGTGKQRLPAEEGKFGVLILLAHFLPICV